MPGQLTIRGYEIFSRSDELRGIFYWDTVNSE